MVRHSLAGCLVLGGLLVTGLAIAEEPGAPSLIAPQSSSTQAIGALASQTGPPSALDALHAQPGSHAPLEIAPQPSGELQPKINEIPSARQFKRSENYTALDRKFDPNLEQGDGEAPYLGVTVRYTRECYLGQEEHGLEVLNVYPGSPADKAGVKGYAPPSFAGAMFGPLYGAVSKLFDRAGVVGHGGDLIIAVDDHRVHDDRDLERELRKLKPGDKMYLTVLRPLPGGAHQTLKIAINVGEPVPSGKSPELLALESVDEAMQQFATEWDEPSAGEASASGGESFAH